MLSPCTLLALFPSLSFPILSLDHVRQQAVRVRARLAQRFAGSEEIAVRALAPDAAVSSSPASRPVYMSGDAQQI